MVLRGTLNHAGAGHGIFRFEDFAATLINDGQLGEGEGVGWGKFGDATSMQNGVVEASEFLLVDGERHVGADVFRVIDQDFLQLIDAGFEVALRFELDGGVVELFGSVFGHGGAF